MKGRDFEKAWPNLYTPEDAKRIEEEIDDLERQLRPAEDDKDVGFLSHAKSKIQDAGEIRKEILKKKHKKAVHSPKPFDSPQKANKAFEWAKGFQSWYRDNGPTVKEDGLKPGDPDFQRAVNRALHMSKPQVQQSIQIYRHIMQRLDPQNPNAGDLSRLRRRA